jgi:tetratricopeptide (TPR) repeat protein
MKVSRFTPSLMKHEDLEEIFVQRHKLAQNIVELIRHSVITPSKHHTLLVGPRGIGKTHLVSLVYYRIREMDDLDDRLLIAWLREEEWGITSFLDLLLRIFRALQEEYTGLVGQARRLPLLEEGGQDAHPTREIHINQLLERIEALYQLPPDAAEGAGAELLKEVIGNCTLLLLMENLDDVFAGLADEGQKRLRAFLQENACCTILATSQSLFNGVKHQTSPFYGFFRIHHLEDLTSEDATQLLANIARLEGDRELESFIQMPTGRDRIRAVHHLAGGSHRVYVIFSEFLTRESLDELVEPFMRMLDDLTPYYQARMQWLSPQQRKIIEFLCDRRHAVPVKEIAQRCFMTHQTASGQLKDLREKGYVTSVAIGRESYYELREVLMRFCLEVKKQRGETIQLFVDFLRLWYSKQELQERLDRLSSAEMLQAPSLEREYVLHALKAITHDSLQQHSKNIDTNATVEASDEDPRLAAYWEEYRAYYNQNNWLSALSIAEKLVAIRGQASEWFEQGNCMYQLKRYEEAIASFDQAIELQPDHATAWYNRGIALKTLGQLEQAIASYDKAIELQPDDATAWNNRGIALYFLGQLEQAIASYDKAIELKPDEAFAWNNRGTALYFLGHLEQAIASFDKAIELKVDDHYTWYFRGIALYFLGQLEQAIASYDKAIELQPDEAFAWNNRGNALKKLGHLEQAIASFDKAIELQPDYPDAWNNRGNALYSLGQLEQAIASFDKAIELQPDYPDAWNNRGNALYSLGQLEQAIASYDKAIELQPDYPDAWNNRGNALYSLGHLEQAIASYDKAIELQPDYATAWNNRGIALGNLGQLEQAIASYDKAIELQPDYATAWNNRGIALGNLGQLEQAIASYDKAIELQPDDASAWNNRGWVLDTLGRYEEALASCDKAIELGDQSSNVFFNRAIALLGLNHWDEGIVELDNALDRLAEEPGKEAYAEDVELIFRNLFNNTHDAAIWKTRITTLITLYNKHQVISALGQGLVRSIAALMSEMVSDKAAQTWLEVWQELTSDYSEFQIPLRLLNAAVRYRQTKGDKRVLLELPIEERNLLKPLLGISEGGQ